MEAVNPYESPKSVTTTSSSDSYQPKIFAINGRIGRLRYLAYGMLATMVSVVIIGIAAAILIPIFASSTGGLETAGVLLVLVFYLPLLIFSIILMKRRLNDLDKSGWWQLLIFIPIVGIIFGLYVLLWPGTKGSNNYGLQPEKNSPLLIIAGLIVPLFLIGILAAIAIPAYQDYVERAQQVMESQQ